MRIFLKKFFSLVLALLIALVVCPINSLAESGTTVNYIIEIGGQLESPVSVYDNTDFGFSLFNTETFSGSYGNQLSGDSKGIYDAFKESYVDCRTADSVTYVMTEDYSFNTTYIPDENGGTVEENQAYNDTVYELTVISQLAIDAFLYDNPDVFWLSSMSFGIQMSIRGESNDDVTCTITEIHFYPVETYSGSASNISNYDESVNRIVSNIKNDTAKFTSRREILKYIHDYICENAYYDYSNPNIAHSSERFFIGNGGVVCEGYAKAFKVICDRLGIPCVCVAGSADTNNGTELHMWNYVMLEDGRWHLIDITWDDQESGIYYTYFLANWNSQGFYEMIYDERRENGDFSGTGYKNFVYPVLCSSEFPDSTDMVIIRNSLMKKIISYDIAMDYNGDNTVDARDIVRVKRILAGIDFSA